MTRNHCIRDTSQSCCGKSLAFLFRMGLAPIPSNVPTVPRVWDHDFPTVPTYVDLPGGYLTSKSMKRAARNFGFGSCSEPKVVQLQARNVTGWHGPTWPTGRTCPLLNGRIGLSPIALSHPSQFTHPSPILLLRLPETPDTKMDSTKHQLRTTGARFCVSTESKAMHKQ